MNNIIQLSLRQYAMISGVSLIIMAMVAGYSYGYVHQNTVIPNDPHKTLSLLKESIVLFKSSIVGWVLVLILDLIVTWGLFQYFRSKNKRISWVAAVFRGSYSIVLAYAIFSLIQVGKELNTTQPDAIFVSKLIEHFEQIWSYGLIIFGFHLICIGRLFQQSIRNQNWLAYLLFIGGLSYVIIHLAYGILPNWSHVIQKIELVLSFPMAISEIGLAIWLIRKGGVKQSKAFNPSYGKTKLKWILPFVISSLFMSCDFPILFLPESVQEEVNQALDKGFDGIILYVNRPGDTSFYTAGYHNRETKTATYPHALFKIASISKLYIAAATAKLVASEKLSLEDKLSDLLPRLAKGIEYSDQITLKMLVEHRSGIPDFCAHSDFPWTDPYKDYQEAYSLVLGQKANFQPGKKYEYSNTNYLLIGDILDRVLGYSHHLYIKEKLLNPLGLTNTYNLMKEANLDDVMSGYFIGYENDIKYNDFIHPGGSMVASAEDTGIFLRALIDKQILTSKEQEIYDSIYKFEHTGLLPGYQSVARYHPGIDAVVVLFVNKSSDTLWFWNVFETIYKRIVKIIKNLDRCLKKI